MTGKQMKHELSTDDGATWEEHRIETPLKTLKELKIAPVFEKWLRTEAIFQVKKLDEQIKFVDDGISGHVVTFCGKFRAPIELKAIQDYIIWQNNLVEDDLK